MGTWIVYAEFDKTWYKIWYTIVCEITSRTFGISWFITLDQLTNRAISFSSLSASLRSPRQKTYSPVCQPVSPNKLANFKSPGLYFTNEGVLSHWQISTIHIFKLIKFLKVHNKKLCHLIFFSVVLSKRFFHRLVHWCECERCRRPKCHKFSDIFSYSFGH